MRARALFAVAALALCACDSSGNISNGTSPDASASATSSGAGSSGSSNGAATSSAQGSTSGSTSSSGSSSAAGASSGSNGSSGSPDASGSSEAGSSGSSGGPGGTDGGAAQSAGCGKTPTLQNGNITITSDGASRDYVLQVPDNYDKSHPYRLVIAYAWDGASAAQVASTDYFTFSTLDSNKTTIFAAPDAVGGGGVWSSADVAFTDAILAQIEGDLCIDQTRLFATGFSFGGAMSIAIACNRANVFRGVAFFSGADLTGSCPTTPTTPIAYYASQASQDHGSLPANSPIAGEVIQAQFAAVNGCMAQPAAVTFPASGQAHTCTNYQGCSPGHPTEYCVFNGGHGWQPVDPGQTTSWDSPEAWKFITQF